MNGYELSRYWFDFAFENPERISPNHAAIYFFAIEHCNRLGWKDKFGFPTQMAMDAIGIKKHQTYIMYFNDLVEWGFFKLVQKSKNQYSANIISLQSALPKNGKAMDKAIINHAAKQTQTNGQSTGQSNSSIDKPITINQEPQTTNQDNTGKKFVPSGTHQTFIDEYSLFYEKRVGIIPKITAQDGKAVKELIPYLVNVSTKKTEESAVESLKYIFENWDKLEPFLRDQIKLIQINSNINNIINQIKNGSSKSNNNEPRLADRLRAKYSDKVL